MYLYIYTHTKLYLTELKQLQVRNKAKNLLLQYFFFPTTTFSAFLLSSFHCLRAISF